MIWRTIISFLRRHRDITGIKSASIIENLSIRTLIVRKARQQFSSNLFAISPNQFREMDTVMKCLASPTMVLISICPFIWVFHELFELYYWCSLYIVLLISKCTSSVCWYRGDRERNECFIPIVHYTLRVKLTLNPRVQKPPIFISAKVQTNELF